LAQRVNFERSFQIFMRYLKAFFPHFTYCIRNTALSHRRSAGRDWGFYFLTFGLCAAALSLAFTALQQQAHRKAADAAAAAAAQEAEAIETNV
jgi:hypothetical protein